MLNLVSVAFKIGEFCVFKQTKMRENRVIAFVLPTHSTLSLSAAAARHTRHRQAGRQAADTGILAGGGGGVRAQPTVCEGNGNGNGDCDCLSAFFDCKLFFICGPETRRRPRRRLKKHAREREAIEEGERG